MVVEVRLAHAVLHDSGGGCPQACLGGRGPRQTRCSHAQAWQGAATGIRVRHEDFIGPISDRYREVGPISERYRADMWLPLQKPKWKMIFHLVAVTVALPDMTPHIAPISVRYRPDIGYIYGGYRTDIGADHSDIGPISNSDIGPISE